MSNVVIQNVSDEFDIDVVSCVSVRSLIKAFEDSIEFLKQFDANDKILAYVETVEGEVELIASVIEIHVEPYVIHVSFKEKAEKVSDE